MVPESFLRVASAASRSFCNDARFVLSSTMASTDSIASSEPPRAATCAFTTSALSLSDRSSSATPAADGLALSGRRRLACRTAGRQARAAAIISISAPRRLMRPRADSGTLHLLRVPERCDVVCTRDGCYALITLITTATPIKRRTSSRRVHTTASGQLGRGWHPLSRVGWPYPPLRCTKRAENARGIHSRSAAAARGSAGAHATREPWWTQLAQAAPGAARRPRGRVRPLGAGPAGRCGGRGRGGAALGRAHRGRRPGRRRAAADVGSGRAGPGGLRRALRGRGRSF
mmetsp:Transcript_11550/g.34008  ORF Transcript_11550/g.34008 Transcript_11550/m.34008 type:complete len:288 (+) Transcript_11550:1183-2046(+)